MMYGSLAPVRPPVSARTYAAPNAGTTLDPRFTSSSHHSCTGESNSRFIRADITRGLVRKCP